MLEPLEPLGTRTPGDTMKLDSTLLIGAAAILGIGLIVVSTEVSDREQAPAAPAIQEDQALPPGHPPLDGSASGGAEPAGTVLRGTVQETIPASRYVFLQVDVEGAPVWIATGAIEVSEGDEVAFGEGMPMQDFYSQTLDRTFDEILFVGGVQVVPAR